MARVQGSACRGKKTKGKRFRNKVFEGLWVKVLGERR